jgi:hypothetical protein
VAAGIGLAIGSGMYIIGVGAGLLLFVLLQFAGPEEFIRNRRKRAGFDSIDPENDFVPDPTDRPISEPLQRSPLPSNAALAQLPTIARPVVIPAHPAYAPWSTAAYQESNGPS